MVRTTAYYRTNHGARPYASYDARPCVKLSPIEVTNKTITVFSKDYTMNEWKFKYKVEFNAMGSILSIIWYLHLIYFLKTKIN